MVPSILSEELHRRTVGSELIIYPDSCQSVPGAS
jgi:hypothetical protein